MDLFRAVLLSGEKSQRVLQLIEELLETNPANYTIWYYSASRIADCVSGSTDDRCLLISKLT
jgi:hypothetical protein